MRRVLVSMMCHPDREPRITVPPRGGFEVFVNRTPNYADAYRFAIERAKREDMDLVTSDTDGYHPAEEVSKLASEEYSSEEPVLVLPFRENIGAQSKAYSLFYSAVKWKRIRDATGGLCRLSNGLMMSLPPLKSVDMTVHIEILNFALRTKARVIQYPYRSGTNDEAGSRRTANYQWKLLKAAFR